MGQNRYFVTVCTAERRAVLVNEKVVVPIIDFLKEISSGYNFIVWAYCFMPDHAHFLFEGKSADSDFKKFISMFKQKTAFWYSRNFGDKLWQINYYEHILRKEEDLSKTVFYIFMNPVREGLVNDHREFQFSGSFEFSLGCFI